MVDDEILNFFRSKEWAKRSISAERVQKLDNRIRSCSVDDETLLGDEKISNLLVVTLIIPWKKIDGGLELLRSRCCLKSSSNFFIAIFRKSLFTYRKIFSHIF